MLTDGVSLAPAPDMLFQLYSYLTGGARRQKAKALAAGEDPDGDAASLDVLAAIEKFPGVRPDPEAFIEALDPLQPRLYSISSSPKANPGRVSLTVDTVRYKIGKRERLGVASTFLAGRVAASVLRAAGVPELVVESIAGYEALALRLATRPEALSAVRDKLEANRMTCALFDSDRYRRHLESAFITMRDRARAGLAPASFTAA